ncbi:MAG: hypothetical protein LBI05_10880 [Planctomycetaceae bacterium]|jgi:hypothetical protein|nr:hypothetical protein [Planctomycetaceae bacterium]
MSILAESGRNIQMRVSEGFCREINKLDTAARLHALELIVESLKRQDDHLMSEHNVPHLTDLRGMGCGTWGSKEEIDTFIQHERESWHC